MNGAGFNVSLLKTPLLVTFASFLMTAILLIAINLISEKARQDFTQISQAVEIERESLQKRLEANQLYKEYKTSFLNQFVNGLDLADKLLWIEQLQLQAEQIGLPSLTYNIKSRRPEIELNAGFIDGFGVYATDIEIKAGLMHEGQLLALKDNLHDAGLGLFSFDYCDLKARNQAQLFKPGVANLEVDCRIKWFEIAKTEDIEADIAAGEQP